MYMSLHYLQYLFQKIVPDTGTDSNFKIKAQTDCAISGQLLELLRTVFSSFKVIDQEDNEQIYDLIR